MKWTTMALVAAFAVSANAFYLPDATVVINRSANERTLTVRYTGAAAKIAELRVNGKSIASRTLDSAETAGETSFELNPALLEDGKNTIEIRLLDADGKVVGTEETVITMERGRTGPVFIKNPAKGSQIKGQVEITVGFEVELKDVYVSFFVDGEFQSLRNTAPYKFLWETSRVTNGWHEVQAWVIDAGNNTHKTERVRVFVNNPGGRTDREGVDTTTTPTTPVTDGGEPTENVERPVVNVEGETIIRDLAPSNVDPIVSDTSGAKPPETPAGIPYGPRHMTPTGERTVNNNSQSPDMPVLVNNTPPADIFSAGAAIPITFGARVPTIGVYSISLDGKAIDFDVQPHVNEEGVPLTPFRHLFEGAGGEVNWEHATKTVEAVRNGEKVWFQVGSLSALVNGNDTPLEMAPFIKGGRAIVPLSFITNALNVQIAFDAETKHVLIGSTITRKSD